MINVKLISEKIIKPSTPTPTHLRLLQTSLFDHVNVPIFMPLICFFSPTKPSINTTEFLHRLKTALPATLSVFYPLAGRVQDSSYIACNDEGVPYVEALVSGSNFEDFVYKAEVCELDKLLPYHGQDGYTRLLLAFQINTFPCGGVAIGVKFSHALSDGFSICMLIKTWAAIANGNDYKLLGKPFFEISKLFPPPPSQQSQLQENIIDSFGPNPDLIKDKPVTKWFKFSKAKLDDLRSKLISNVENIPSIHAQLAKKIETPLNKKASHERLELNSVSSKSQNEDLPSHFFVLSAFIMSRIKLACRDNVENLPYEVYSAVNVRSKVSTPKESYFYGNMVINAITKPSVVANNTKSLSVDFMYDLSKSIRNILSDSNMIKNAQEGKEDLSFMMDHFEREARGEVISLGFSSVRSLPMYEADFGWGKPVWVTSATQMFKDLIVFLPFGPSSKDIMAFINLTGEEMDKLSSDKEFLSVASFQALSKL